MAGTERRWRTRLTVAWVGQKERTMRTSVARASARLFLVMLGVIAGVGQAAGQVPSLSDIPVARPPNLGEFIRDEEAAKALGKALFWDMQVGSDGVQACATCHFRAGADPRSINQANPGRANNPDLTVNVGINHQLSAADFPLHLFADATSRNSQVLRDNDDVISSQCVKLSRFVRAVP